MERHILHVDMDAYFASVERVLDPSLRGKPIAVIGTGKRTVVLSPSYEARKYGVKTGMTVGEARKRYAGITLVKAHIDEYIKYSQVFLKILYDFTPLVESYSIDEAFMDVTGSRKLMGDPIAIAGKIKHRILHELGITCSIGIAPNKLLAKIASDLKKPDGISVIDEQYLRDAFPLMPVKSIPGIGPSATAMLARAGIKTCRDLAGIQLSALRHMFGTWGDRLYEMARGVDDGPVIPFTQEREARSIGNSMTLDQDCSDTEQIKSYILELSDIVGERMREEKYTGSTVSLTIRYSDFETVSYQRKLPEPTDLTTDIYKTALKLLADHRLKMPVRLVGVTASDLTRLTTGSLFQSDRKLRQAFGAMDTINKRFGESSLTIARLVKSKAYRPAIPPSFKHKR